MCFFLIGASILGGTVGGIVGGLIVLAIPTIMGITVAGFFK
ncbi:MAG: hypothetical protein WCE94_14470 [Candidatus Methanoperedens sp.]